MIILPQSVFYLGIIYTVLVSWTAFYRCYEFYISQKTKKEIVMKNINNVFVGFMSGLISAMVLLFCLH